MPSGDVTRDLVFDIGMHRGEDTAFYLALGYRVVAFEANPELVAHCEQRFSAAIAEKRLSIVSGAIAPADRQGPVTFYKNARKSVWGTTVPTWVERNRAAAADVVRIEVPAVDFEAHLRRHGTPFFAKIDVEGVDDLVRNALCSAVPAPPLLSLESEKVDFAQLEDTVAGLVAAGYRHFGVVQQAGIPGRRDLVTRVDGSPTHYRFEKHASGPFGVDLRTEWLTAEQALDVYRGIFRHYQLIGDGSFLGRWGRLGLKAAERMFRIGLPGWHDLHAARDLDALGPRGRAAGG